MPEAAMRERLRAILPFEPTGGQWRAVAEIEEDLAATKPMLRLLQGDVGAGKTAVGFAACLAVASARGQVAWMVPTEMLAIQHARTLDSWCRSAGLRLAVLTSRMPVARRRRIVEQIASAQIDLVVGTHALLSEDVAFARLGLAVIDEQHRFGVAQRALLRAKGTTPHLLVMTATPIPRTLALTSYGELDVSLIRELPPGRTPSQTKLFAGTRVLAKAREQLAKHIEQGAQAFVVCPRIERVGAQDISHVEDAAEWLRERLPGHGVGVIHGKLATGALEDAVAKFARGELAVLVATTVIEVGIDLPNARAMLIEHADRFGLAQLHQLRGRIGRAAGGTSWCLLHTKQAPSSDAHRRLSVLVEAHDGFRVAEMDLELRGPGEIFGTRQAGSPGMFAACLTGPGIELLLAARETART
ncbi:MAG: ATP-dependent DNA helicase RecG, partial [Nannocystaceae bacterium]